MATTETENHKIETAYVPVSPEIAQRWLAGNTVNRTLRTGIVRKYAADMLAGRWVASNDAICFDPSGRLLNGQHRLNAIVLADTTITMLVVRNMPSGTMVAMDQGAKRSAADALGFAGEKNTTALASTARLLFLHESGQMYRDHHTQRVSNGQILDFVDMHPDLRDLVNNHRQTAHTLDVSPSAVLAAIWLIAQKAGEEHAVRYLHQLASRANEPEGSAVLAVDSRIRDLRRNKKKYQPRQVMYLLVKGWNHWARDSRVRTLSVAPRGKFKIPEPIVWQRGDGS